MQEYQSAEISTMQMPDQTFHQQDQFTCYCTVTILNTAGYTFLQVPASSCKPGVSLALNAAGSARHNTMSLANTA
jgi:hypothetical protein